MYTLWQNPGILPLLHTPSIVVKKIQGGADLMTPGLAGGPPFPQRAKKGALVAIASTESPTVPVAVGVCEVDISSLGSVQGSKGHAVQILHWAGDELWAWSASGKPGGVTPDHLDGWLDEQKTNKENSDSEDEMATKGISSMKNDQDDDGKEDESGGVSLKSSQNKLNGIRTHAGKSKSTQVQEEVEEDEGKAPIEEKEREMTTKGE